MMKGMQIRKILVPTDFSHSAEGALEWAKAQARVFGAETAVLHVVAIPITVATDWSAGVHADPGIGPLLDRISLEAQRSLAALEEAPEITHSLFRMGDPGEEIIKVAQRWGADLIVMGTRGRHGTSDRWLGNVAQYVLRHAAVPVLLVREPVEQPAADADTPAVTTRAEGNGARTEIGGRRITRAGEMFADLRHTSRLEHMGNGRGRENV